MRGNPREEANPSRLLVDKVPISDSWEIAMSINLNYSHVCIDYYNFDVITMLTKFAWRAVDDVEKFKGHGCRSDKNKGITLSGFADV